MIRFSGELWPVHPNREEIKGLRTYRSVADLPSAPDASFIGINRDETIKTVQTLSRRGAGGAICFASGFREAGAANSDGYTKQDQLVAAADGMTILGPNCYGLINYVDGVALWPDQHGGVRVESGVAIVTQSSNIALNLTMQDRGLPVSYVVTVGNQAQTGLSTICSTLLQDPRVTALGLHIEGIDDLRAFESMAEQAHAAQKPVIALKVGRSDQAKAATVSHTASIAGSETGSQALLKRLGIGQVFSLPALLETLKLMHVHGPISSNRIASMSCSGGEAGLVSDAAHGLGLEFPVLDPEQRVTLCETLGAHVAMANPLDYHTDIWGDAVKMTRTFTAVMRGDHAMGCVVLDFPRADRCDVKQWEPVIEAVALTKASTAKPMAILSTLKENLSECVASRLIDMGIVPFTGLDEAVAAMAVAASLGQYRQPPDKLLLPIEVEASRTLTEAEAKEALSLKGVLVPKAATADSVEAAISAASHIGFPVALKAEGFAHKTEAGALALDLSDPDAVERAARAMPAQSFLIEQMIVDTVAEMLIGVVADPGSGYVLTLAAGGVLAELLGDRVSLLVPASRDDVADALDGLRLARLLKGYRGMPAANLDAIVDTVMAVQTYVANERPLEVEINPLMCCPTRAVAADALIRIGV